MPGRGLKSSALIRNTAKPHESQARVLRRSPHTSAAGATPPTRLRRQRNNTGDVTPRRPAPLRAHGRAHAQTGEGWPLSEDPSCSPRGRRPQSRKGLAPAPGRQIPGSRSLGLPCRRRTREAAAQSPARFRFKPELPVR